jgi:two-component system, LytTR family, sensor histidine kinase AlgZ
VKRPLTDYWRRILLGNLAAAAIALFVFGGASWTTPVAQLVRSYVISLLFATCIGPMLGLIMPRLAPWIWRRAGFPMNWVVVILVMTAIAVIGSVMAIAILVGVGVVPGPDFLPWLTGSARTSIAITLIIGLFITSYELMRARVAQASAEARLATLESRVQPHFLFNALNSIASLIHEDPQGAERMTGQLASLLRSSLAQEPTALVPLEDELRIVRAYLAIEQVRFGNRLRYAIKVDDAVLSARIPRLALQTIVENSVKYAVSPRREGASITLSASRPAPHENLIVRVDDDGSGFDARQLPDGHGLALLRDRLALLFSGRGALNILELPAGTRVELVVPHGNALPAALADPGCGPRPPEHADASRLPG